MGIFTEIVEKISPDKIMYSYSRELLHVVERSFKKEIFDIIYLNKGTTIFDLWYIFHHTHRRS